MEKVFISEISRSLELSSPSTRSKGSEIETK
jgi:hypothetical protein